MKRKLLIQSGITLVVLFVLAFGIGVGQAYATTGCFTDTIGSWAETYICWMADNGITGGTAPGIYSPDANVTRAQMAVFMNKQAEIPPSTGNIYINAGNNGWTVNGNFVADGYIRYFDRVIRLNSDSATVNYYQLTPDLPGSLYGRQMYFHGVKLCYDATQGQIDMVRLDHWSGGATPVIYHQVIDSTVRVDAACRTYTFPTDGSLWGSEHVVLYIAGNFASAANFILVSATTFIMVPSAGTGSLSPEDTFETHPDMPASQPAYGEPGTDPTAP